MLKYIFSILFIVFAINLSAQNYTPDRSQETTDQLLKNDSTNDAPRVVREKLPYPHKRRGTSITFDLGQLLAPTITSGRHIDEIGFRTNFKKRMFIVGDVGFEKIKTKEKTYSYDSDGFYGRIGFDYDIFIVDDPGNNDNILVGVNYGFASQKQSIPSAIIENPYWKDNKLSFSNSNVTTHWLELSGGLRTQLFNNLYMSWFIRIRCKINTNNKEIFTPYRIPGYGKGANGVNLGFVYKIGYQIPWGNKKHKKSKYLNSGEKVK